MASKHTDYSTVQGSVRQKETTSTAEDKTSETAQHCFFFAERGPQRGVGSWLMR